MERFFKAYPNLKDCSEEVINFIKTQIKNGDSNIRRYIKSLIGPFTIENYLKYKNMPKKQYYNIEYNMCKYSISEEEAINKINELKSKTSCSKENFIKRYGEEEGIKRFNEFREKSSHTKEKFVEKYGEHEGEEKWNLYIEDKKYKSSISYYKDKYKDNWETEYNKIKEKRLVTLENMIFKYGEEEGILRYNKSRLLKSISGKKEAIIQKYGEEKYKEIHDSKRTQKGISDYINEFGYEDGANRFMDDLKELHNKEDLMLYKLISRYGYKNGIDNYIYIKENKRNRKTQASKESLNVFEASINFMKENNILFFVGDLEKKEFFIKEDKKYFYDLTIPSLNLIFEYNGSHVHANPNWDPEKLASWKHKYTGKNAIDVINEDNKKIEIAKKYGFDIYVLWDSDDIDYNSEKIFNILKEKYENQKNNR